MGKVLATDVHVTDPETWTVTVLKAGSKLPKKFEDIVTNKKVFVDEVAEPDLGEAAVTGVEYGTLQIPELKALLKERKLAITGKQAVLVARLQEADAAQAAAAAVAQTDGSAGEVPVYEDLDQDALIELLKKRELPVDGEIAELIERLEFDDLEREESNEE